MLLQICRGHQTPSALLRKQHWGTIFEKNSVVLIFLDDCTTLIRTLITVYSVSFYLLLLEFDIQSCGRSSAIGVWLSRCRMYQFSRSFLPAHFWMWNDLPYTVCDTGTLDVFMGAVKSWLLHCVVFSSVFRGTGKIEESHRRWLHIPGSCSQASRQTCCCCLP